MITWTNIRVRLGALKPWAQNPRMSSKRQAQRLLESWKEYGQVQTIAVSPTLEVYDGHQRLSALLTVHGHEYEIDARQSDRALTDDERRRLVVLLHAGAQGAWNWDLLSGWDESLLTGAGMDESFLKQLNTDAAAMSALLDSVKGGGAEADAEPQIDRAAELNEKWQVKPGDLWRIGDHRLLCGDSTKAADVARVMGGEKADCVFTDPPYNVASEGRNYAADAPTQKKTYEAIKEAEWDKGFDIKPFLVVAESIMADDCAVYVCTSQWLVQTIWEWMWKWSKYCSYVVWCKPNPAPSLAKRHWTWATELIPYAVRGKHICNFPAQGHALNWWDVQSGTHTEPHPTQKPTEIPRRAIAFSSAKGATVFDGFAGSGTTMVACENLVRKCRGIEISPDYCAVILERMATAFPALAIERMK